MKEKKKNTDHLVRRHPDRVVELFLNADPNFDNLLEILAREEVPASSKVEAIKLLLEVLLGMKPFEGHMQRVESAYRERSNVDLHLVFLIVWFHVLLVRGSDWASAGVLRDRIVSLVGNTTPAEIAAWATLVDSLVEFFSGNVVAYQEKIKDLGVGVSPTSPHYERLMELRASGYFQLGTRDVAEAPPNRGTMTEFETRRIQGVRMINCALRGEVPDDVEQLVASSPPLAGQYVSATRQEHSVARATLQMMAAWRRGEMGSIEGAEVNLGEEGAWIISTRYLLAGRPKDALKWARIHQQQRALARRWPISFDGYTLIRAELASGHSDVARRLLLVRKERGTCHYVDSLFYARADLLDGKEDLAAQHFARVMRDAETYQAQGRLDFELALAAEIRPTQLMELSRRAARVIEEGDKDEVAEAAPRRQMTQRHRGVERLVFSSAALATIRERVLAFAQRDVPVLVTGETGTGKELIAQALHESGPRSNAPFVAINCGALSDTLVESELFGHERGAFTGAQAAHAGLFRDAKKGTIFLDEIGDISSRLQVALLRVLETGEARPVGSSRRYKIACRVIAATNADLEQRVEEGRFRQDLFFRLQRLRVHLPPLRDRPDDIVTLAQSFFDLDRTEGQRTTLTPALVTALQRHPWPGNVRELRNAIEQMRVLSSDSLGYDLEDLESVLAAPQREPEPAVAAPAFSAPSSATEHEVAEERSQQPPTGSAAPGRKASLGTAIATEEIEDFLRGGRSTLRRIARLEAVFQRFPQLKTHEVARILGVSRQTARKDLEQLCARGVIEKITPSAARSTHYYTLVMPERGAQSA